MSSILVVDDERGIRALCGDVLGRAGHNVEAVDSAAGAVAAVARRRYDLVLCDINLPDQDGVSLLPRLLIGEPPPAVLLITVTDEGPGVPASDRARVFDPFFTTKAADAGTGLGLAVCKHLVATAGGSIEVGDGPGGRGAEFRVVIPNAS